MTTQIARLDANGIAIDVTVVDDVSKWPGFIDATGAGYLWRWTGSAWVDTAAAQAWRNQQHAAAVAVDVEARVVNSGHTLSELYMRLLYTSIKRVPALTQTALEKAFISAVDAADAETP